MARDAKIRQRLFPNVPTFDPKVGGYASFPFVMRRLQFLFEPRAWQVYSYVLMRIGPHGIGWLTMSEMSWDLDFKSIPKLNVYVDKLVEDGWLKHSTSRAREYFLAPDPMFVVKQLAAAKKLSAERIEAIDEVLESLKWKTIQSDADDDADADDEDDEPGLIDTVLKQEGP